MKKTLVVARYNESIDWLKGVNGWNIVLYNKGEPIETEYRTINLLNTGREAHTYLKHIIDNYDNLSDYVLFIQGHPFDHTHQDLTKTVDMINSFSLENVEHFKPLVDHDLECDLNGKPHHPSELLIEEYTSNYSIIVPNRLIFTPGAQFIVTRQAILSRPKKFYEDLLANVSHGVNQEAYILERLWRYIFS